MLAYTMLPDPEGLTLRKSLTTNAGQDVGERKPSFTVGETVNTVQLIWKSVR